ncbi:MAG: cell division protein FtsZ [Saprospiraceae bacterium]|nr:cell division protein FtsZ [Saprospiraceae bacterium]
MQFDIPKEDRSIIKVIGVGGGGCNAVTHMFKQGIVGVDFAICNTDNQSMELSPVPTKIQLGPHLTEGRGAGSLPQVGKQACIESIDDVRRFIEPETKMIFITAGMGGGTGTGAAPIIAKAAKELDILTVAIVTIPFRFEGRRRKEQAAEGLEELKNNVDSLIIVSNDKLREIHGNLPVSEAFSHADNILSTAAKGIAEIITVAGYVNVDFEDVNTVMRDSGVSIMGTAMAEGEGRARKAVDEALNSPLLEDNDIRGAKHILLNITSGTKEVTMDEIYEITEFIQDEAGYDTDLIWGNCVDESLGDKVCVTVIATGFEHRKSMEEVVEQRKEKIVVSLEDERHTAKDRGLYDTGYKEGDFKKSYDLNVDAPYNQTQRPHGDPYVKAVNNQVQEKSPNDQSLSWREQQAKEELRARNKKLNNPQAVIELENEPAYLRRKVELDDVPHSSEITVSRWTITGEEEPEIRRDNPYLHDNVD